MYLVILLLFNTFCYGHAQNSSTVCSTYCQSSCDDVKYIQHPKFADNCRQIQTDCECLNNSTNKSTPSSGKNESSPVISIIWVLAFVALLVFSSVGGIIQQKYGRQNPPESGCLCCGFPCSCRPNCSFWSTAAPTMQLPITAQPVTTVPYPINA